MAAERGEFWMSSEHTSSGRVAAVADEGESVWLYVTERDADDIVAGCWLFNRVPAPGEDEIEARAAEYEARREPPPAPREVIGDDARLEGPLEGGRVRFVWSTDGESVAVSIDGDLAGFVARAEPDGYSTQLRVECAWGRPLDLTLYAELFGAPLLDT